MKTKGSGKVVFIAHPYRGDEEANLKRVERYIRHAIEQDQHPCCPWYAMVRALDDGDDTVRERGIKTNFAILARCDELWVCGDWPQSAGVQEEMDYASSFDIPIRYMNLVEWSEQCDPEKWIE